jgi:DNA-binding response OmpR family regulator
MDSPAPAGIPGRARAVAITAARPEPPPNVVRGAAQLEALVLDDCRFLTERLARTLVSRGFTSVLASDGYVGLELLRSRRFALVVLAVELPIVAGFTVLRQLRNDRVHAAIPVLMLGGDRQASDADRERALQLGATGYLTKPLQLRSFNATLDSLCEPP